MKSTAIIFATLLALLGLGQATAELKTTPGTNSQANPGIRSETDYVADAKNAWIKPRQIKCWQEGRLIVEENDWVPSDTRKHVAFVRNKDDVLYMFDFNKTFCLYRQSEVGK
jgi:hypothetical protein